MQFDRTNPTLLVGLGTGGAETVLQAVRLAPLHLPPGHAFRALIVETARPSGEIPPGVEVVVLENGLGAGNIPGAALEALLAERDSVLGILRSLLARLPGRHVNVLMPLSPGGATGNGMVLAMETMIRQVARETGQHVNVVQIVPLPASQIRNPNEPRQRANSWALLNRLAARQFGVALPAET